MDGEYDLAIIGGGVNGCGIARDAAGRGLSVFLCEKDDLASGTSSASTKLVHGGLRYLEYYEFRLVREALAEREVLLRAAPHIIWPLRFVLPHQDGMRAQWMIRVGLMLYDHIGGRKLLPPARKLDLRDDPAGEPLKAEYQAGFEYSDCWVEDSRLVVLNAMDAAARGATIVTRAEMKTAERSGRTWRLVIREGGVDRSITARALVNAAGPWVGDVLTSRIGTTADAPVRLVKGSHIVVPRLFEHERAYIFQIGDGRIVFAIPYERDFTLIGTTDLDYRGDPGEPQIAIEETDYLCSAASEYFRKPVRAADVVWSYSGVRPLYDDGASEAQAATRDYVLKVDGGEGRAPLLNIYGGKITTYRRLAEAAMKKLAPSFAGMGPAWTAGASLPGGDFPVDGFEAEVATLLKLCPSCGPQRSRRLVRAYGTRARLIAEDAARSGWGEELGAGLSECEVRYLAENEWAQTAEDVLWRRSKLGLRFLNEDVGRLDAFMRRSQSEGEPAAAHGAAQ